jgi:putative transposase
MNPVRARMVDEPGGYAWSSFATNARGRSSTFITPHERYLALGPTDELRQAAYAGLFQIPTTSEELRRIRDAVNGGFALGSESFIAEVERTLGRSVARAFPRKSRADVPLNGTGGLSPV